MSVDLGTLKLKPGEGRRLETEIALEPIVLGGDRYEVEPDPVPVTVDVSKMAGGGWSLRLRGGASLSGPCMRCLEPAAPGFAIDAREVDVPGEEGPDLSSPYVDGDALDLAGWTRDALALALPAQILCDEACPGLCPQCGAPLAADPGHEHPAEPDRRWAKLSEIRFD